MRSEKGPAGRATPGFLMEKPHKDLRAWELGMEVVEAVYEITSSFPSREKFGLTSQLRRSAVSVPSNIAEGAARDSDTDFVRFLHMARSSLSEVDTQMEISRRLGFVHGDSFQRIDKLLSETDRVLSGLIAHVEE